MQNMNMPRSAGNVTSLPWIKAATQRALMKTAADIGGPVDLNPDRRFPGTENAILLEGANLLIAGTHTGPSIGLPDFREAAKRHGMDMLLARFAGSVMSYDIYRYRADDWLTGYQRAYCEGSFWFCPPDDTSLPFIKAGNRGLILSQHAPFANARRFDAGISLAAWNGTEWREAA